MFNVDKRDKDKSRTTLWLLLFLCRHAYEEMVSQSPRECISTVPLLQGLYVGVEEILFVEEVKELEEWGKRNACSSRVDLRANI